MTRLLITLGGLYLSCTLMFGFVNNSPLQQNDSGKDPVYHLAFANFGPLNTDIFIADANGSNVRALASSPALEYNASFSNDGKWVVFTSNRNGSSDIYRIHPDGSGLEQLTD